MSKPPNIRQQRIADEILTEVSRTLQFEVNDPRVHLVTVTRVNVDRELDYASIWVCAAESRREKEIMAALHSAGGFIRYQVAQRLTLRKMPQFRFYWDPAPDAFEQVNRVIDRLEHPAPPETDSADE